MLRWAMKRLCCYSRKKVRRIVFFSFFLFKFVYNVCKLINFALLVSHHKCYKRIRKRLYTGYLNNKERLLAKIL